MLLCPCPRLAKLTTLLRQEEQAREAACTSLHRSQEDIGQRVDEQAARIQVPHGGAFPQASPALALCSGSGVCAVQHGHLDLKPGSLRPATGRSRQPQVASDANLAFFDHRWQPGSAGSATTAACVLTATGPGSPHHQFRAPGPQDPFIEWHFEGCVTIS